MSSKANNYQPTNQDAEKGTTERQQNFPIRIILIAGSIFAFFLIIIMALLCVMLNSINQTHQQTVQPAIKIIENEETDHDSIFSAYEIRLSEEASVQTHPMSQNTEKWKNVSLSCQFDRSVDCRWMRRSQPVDISGRYSFTEPNHLGDCSIHIRSFQKIDEGEWMCIGLFDDQSTLASNKAVLAQAKTTIKPDVSKVTKSIEGSDKKVQSGGEIELNCIFDDVVDCAWMRRGEHIEIKGRYSYVESGNGVGKICSIKIKSAKSIDNGKWECSSMADANSQGIVKSPIQLNVVT